MLPGEAERLPKRLGGEPITADEALGVLRRHARAQAERSGKAPELPEVLLRRSSAVPEGWRLCADGACRAIGDLSETADVVVLKPCP